MISVSHLTRYLRVAVGYGYMSPHSLKARLSQLEAKTSRLSTLPAVRIIQDGEPTEEQKRIIAEAETSGRLVIVREIIRHQWAG